MDDKIIAILLYIPGIPWLIATLFTINSEEFRQDKWQGLFITILFFAPTFGLTQIIAVLYSIFAIKQILEWDIWPINLLLLTSLSEVFMNSDNKLKMNRKGIKRKNTNNERNKNRQNDSNKNM